MNNQGWFPLGLAILISLQFKEVSRVFSSTAMWNINSLAQTFMLSHIHTWLYGPLSAKWCLCFLTHCLGHSFPSKEQVSFSFMTVVTVCNNFGAQENKVYLYFHFSPIFDEVMGPDAMIFVYGLLSFKPAFLLSSFNLIKRVLIPLHFLPLEWCHLHIILLMFLLAILIPVCDLSSPAFFMIYSAYNLNKQGENIQPCHTPFPILN